MTKSVLFSLEFVKLDVEPAVPEDSRHPCRLIRRDHAILEALEEGHRTGLTFGEVDGRSLMVKISPAWMRADEGVDITRLELVRFTGEKLQVADAVVTR